MAALTGPTLLGQLRSHSYSMHAADLAASVPAPLFESTFGDTPSALPELLASRVVTIPQLLKVCAERERGGGAEKAGEIERFHLAV